MPQQQAALQQACTRTRVSTTMLHLPASSHLPGLTYITDMASLRLTFPCASLSTTASDCQ